MAAMTSRHWSISGLSVEFGLDRRTIAKRINHISPVGVEAGSPVWALSDVAPVLAAPSRARKPGSDGPQGAALLDHFAAIPLRAVGIMAPKVMVEAAVADGMDLATAERLFETAKLAIGRLLESVCENCGLPKLFDGATPFAGLHWAEPTGDAEGGEE